MANIAPVVASPLLLLHFPPNKGFHKSIKVSSFGSLSVGMPPCDVLSPSIFWAYSFLERSFNELQTTLQALWIVLPPTLFLLGSRYSPELWRGSLSELFTPWIRLLPRHCGESYILSFDTMTKHETMHEKKKESRQNRNQNVQSMFIKGKELS